MTLTRQDQINANNLQRIADATQRIAKALEGRTAMPAVDAGNDAQNAWVQDWLGAWSTAHPSTDADHEQVEGVIEQVQGTYSPSRHLAGSDPEETP